MDRHEYLTKRLARNYEWKGCDGCTGLGYDPSDGKGRRCFGCSFWEGITIKDTDMVPECLACQEDTRRLKQLAKESKGKTVEFEPKCSRYCLWWDLHHLRRKQACSFVYYYTDTKCVPPSKRYWYYEPSS